MWFLFIFMLNVYRFHFILSFISLLCFLASLLFFFIFFGIVFFFRLSQFELWLSFVYVYDFTWVVFFRVSINIYCRSVIIVCGIFSIFYFTRINGARSANCISCFWYKIYYLWVFLENSLFFLLRLNKNSCNIS